MMMGRTPNIAKMDQPESVTTPKKKAPKRDPKGLKWFKGSTNKTRTPKKLLKHAQKESSPQFIPIPARIVEFDTEGTTERLGISEVLEVIDKGYIGSLLPADLTDDMTNSSFPSSPMPAPTSASRGKGKVGKGKGKWKPPSKRSSNVKTAQKISTNPNNNWSISENSESNSDSLPSKLPEAKSRILDDHQSRIAPPLPNSYIRYIEKSQEELADEVEYDLDEEDCAWLDLVNDKRRQDKLPSVLPENMEFLMDRLEKESYFQMQSTGMDQAPLIDDDAVCCICMDGECQNSNAILFCDMCNLAVHQECYGVPYIPEGQWLCRRCLQSPSRGVDCALCPNKGGAFKQTDDGRWAHVICAIWIPEVCFANTVFLEPIDSVNNIPPARWKLCCYICKQKGVGACIQCHKSNCYTAFHVTCAQQANLCMKMDTVRESNAIIVKKTAYCDHHAPPEPVSPKRKDTDEASPRQKMKQTRKLLAEKRCALPVVSIPTIPTDRVTQIATNVTFIRKHQFMKRLMSYWKLKRQMRNGVPLLRRLQAASLLPSTSGGDQMNRKDESLQVITTSLNYYRYWVRLRQDLEKARLLCELIRKREKIKRNLIHTHVKEMGLKLMPFNSILLNVIDEIAARDSGEIFSNPVDTSEVIDYLLVVEKPMDLSTMKDKVNSFEYFSIDDLEKDFNLMIHNCLIYNSKDTIYYKAAIRLRELGGIVIRQARRLINSIGFDMETGMHLPKRHYELPTLQDSQILDEVESVLENEDRFDLPIDQHIGKLQELLDSTLSLSHPLTRKNRFLRVRQELIRIRKLKHQKDHPCTFKQYKEFQKNKSLLLSDSESVCSMPVDNESVTNERCKPAQNVNRRRSTTEGNTSRSSKIANSDEEEEDNEEPSLERSSARSLRPLKRKILAESPLKAYHKRLSLGSRFLGESPDWKKADTRSDSSSPPRRARRTSVQSALHIEVEPPVIPLTPEKLTPKTTGRKNVRTALNFGCSNEVQPVTPSSLSNKSPVPIIKGLSASSPSNSLPECSNNASSSSPSQLLLMKSPKTKTKSKDSPKSDVQNRKSLTRSKTPKNEKASNKLSIKNKNQSFSTPTKTKINNNNTSPDVTFVKSSKSVDSKKVKNNKPKSSLKKSPDSSTKERPSRQSSVSPYEPGSYPPKVMAFLYREHEILSRELGIQNDYKTPSAKKRAESPKKSNSVQKKTNEKNSRLLTPSPTRKSPEKSTPPRSAKKSVGKNEESVRRTRSKTPSSTTSSPTKSDTGEGRVNKAKRQRKNRNSSSRNNNVSPNSSSDDSVVKIPDSPDIVDIPTININARKRKLARLVALPKITYVSRNNKSPSKSPPKNKYFIGVSKNTTIPLPLLPEEPKPKLNNAVKTSSDSFMQYRSVEPIIETNSDCDVDKNGSINHINSNNLLDVDEADDNNEVEKITENEEQLVEAQQEINGFGSEEEEQINLPNTTKYNSNDLNNRASSVEVVLEDPIEELLDLDEAPDSIFMSSFKNNGLSPAKTNNLEIPIENNEEHHSPKSERSDDAKSNNYIPKPLDTVWYTNDDGLQLPGVVINPDPPQMDCSRKHFPEIPASVTLLKPKSAEKVYLVYQLNGQTSNTNWNWVERSKLEPLGVDEASDKEHLDNASEDEQKRVRTGYERAILHRCRDKLGHGQQSSSQVNEGE